MEHNIYFAKPKYMDSFNQENGYHFKNGESLTNRSTEDIRFIMAATRLFNKNCGDPNAVKVA